MSWQQRQRLSKPNVSDSITEQMLITAELFSSTKQYLSTFRRLSNDYSEFIEIRDKKIAELWRSLTWLK